MKNIPVILSLAAVGALAACVASEPVAPSPTAVYAPGPVVAVVPAGAVVQPAVTVQRVVALRPGVGRIETMHRLNEASAPGYPPAHRIGVVMDDGSAQFVDTQAPNLRLGERVEITANAQLRYPVR